MNDEALSDDDLKDIVLKEIKIAEDYCDGDIGIDRALAMDYYNGLCSLDPEEGRSEVVSTDVRETIDSLMPQLVDMFLSSEKVVEAQPTSAETEQSADAATRVCNYIFFEKNDGGSILQSFAFDGLVCKNGFLKAYWDDTETVHEEQYDKLTPEQMAEVVSSDTVTVTGHTEENGLHSVSIRIKKKNGSVKIEPVPPDEVLVSPRATSCDPDYVPFWPHRQRKTLQQLVEMGYPLDEIEAMGSEDENDLERDSRESGYKAQNNTYYKGREDSADPMQRQVTYYECYYKIDADRDGVTELRRICVAGKKILHNKIVKMCQLISWTPKPRPHEFFGDCPADELIEIQDQKTYLVRQTNDNIALNNNPRLGIDNSKLVPGVTIKDLMNSRSGGIARFNGPPSMAVQQIVTPFIAESTFQMLQYIDEAKEARSGVSKVTQGLDADALNKTSATGMRIVETNSQIKVKRYARNMAGGMVRLFKLVLHLLAENHHKPLVLRVNGKPVQIDPRVWTSDYDFNIKVGLGTGNKDQMLAHLMQIAQAQMAAVQGGGMGLMITPKELYNTQRDIAINAGLPDPSKYWKDPGDVIPPPPPQPPDPIQIQQQIEAIKSQTAEQVSQIKDRAAQAQNERDKQLEMFKFQQSKALEKYKAELDLGKAVRIAAINAEEKITTHSTNARTSIVQSKIASFEKPETMQEQLDGVGLSLDDMPVEPDRPDAGKILEALANSIAMLAQAQTAPKVIDFARDQNGLLTQGLVSTTIQ